MAPGALLYQPTAAREPLAYCLLAARRMWFWQRSSEVEMRFAMELHCREEAEFWGRQAEQLVGMGHAIDAQRAHALGLLPVCSLETLREALEVLKTAASASADARREAGAAPQSAALTLSPLQTTPTPLAVVAEKRERQQVLAL